MFNQINNIILKLSSRRFSSNIYQNGVTSCMLTDVLLKWPFLYIFQAWTTQGSSSERLPRSGHCVDILLSTAWPLGTCHVISGRYNNLLIYSIATQNMSYTVTCWRNPWIGAWMKKGIKCRGLTHKYPKSQYITHDLFPVFQSELKF